MIAKETENPEIVQVKANQPQLLEDCIKTSGNQEPDDTYEEGPGKSRNRIETRKIEVFTDIDITDKEKWEDLIKAIIKVERERITYDTKKKTWEDSIEISYYISTIILSAK